MSKMIEVIREIQSGAIDGASIETLERLKAAIWHDLDRPYCPVMKELMRELLKEAGALLAAKRLCLKKEGPQANDRK